MEYSPRLQEILLKSRERYQKKLAKTIARKLKAGYRFYILIPNGYGHKVYFRNKRSAEQWLKTKYGYSSADQIHELCLVPRDSKGNLL